MKAEAVDGLIIGDSPEHVTNRQFIVDLAARYRLPTIYSSREFVDAGGLLSYGTDLADLYGRVAGVAVEVMRGTKPGDIPFYRQTKFELALNQRAAKSLGLEFPATLLAAADEVIE